MKCFLFFLSDLHCVCFYKPPVGGSRVLAADLFCSEMWHEANTLININQTFIRQYSHWVCGNTTSICCSVDIFKSLIIFQGCCVLAEYLHLGLQFILFWFGLLMVTIHNKDSVLSFVSVCRVQVCRTGQTAKHSAAKQSEIWWNLWWPRTYENFIWKTQRREHFLKTKAAAFSKPKCLNSS